MNPWAIDAEEVAILKRWVEGHSVRSVLEFGPGESTLLFKDLGCEVTSVEEKPEMAHGNPSLILSPFTRRVQEIQGLSESYDLGFIDGPRNGVRKLSRLTPALHCFDRCKLIAMHDTNREQEKIIGSLLLNLGCRILEHAETKRGITLLCHPQ